MGFRITYDSWDGHYIFNTKYGDVQFDRDEIYLQ